MSVTVGEVMRHCRNYFEGEEITVPLTDGCLPGMFCGQWIAVVRPGNLRGVYLAGEDELPRCAGEDEAAVRLLHPPADFLRLCGEISRWSEEHPLTDIVSERYGRYSIDRGTASGWQQVFAPRLTAWRRMFTEVDA